ncbi:hypothetical protein K504DRAFT_467949 [Pleomassaria siparia CBS 279.74]|uniref:Uncharacterized protein n=1 Tax=Pleomassaria siparia CBS 279.74 TaxID=1314801 RepID=A0A6G1K7W5_9PLEO|nr:hypothetical protein K504DRAFT_467949 [Pleomassaria siparia CBS 279.74]
MHHRRHHSLSVDKKTPYSTNKTRPSTINTPVLDLYRSQITIAEDGTRTCDRLGARSKWQRTSAEMELQEKAAEHGKEKLGWFDKDKVNAFNRLKEEVSASDLVKGEVLKGLAEKMVLFFDVATRTYPLAKSFAVFIHRFDDGRIEAILLVDSKDSNRILGPKDMPFEQAIERLTNDVGEHSEAKLDDYIQMVLSSSSNNNQCPEDGPRFWNT